MKSIKTILIIWILVYGFCSCGKERRLKCEGDLMIAYEFDMPIRVSPGNDTIQLGDTLWVELRVDDPTLNKLNGNRYDISKADLRMDFFVQDLLQPTVMSTGNCYRLNEDGQIARLGEMGAYTVTLKKDNGQCYWKCGVVFTQKGLYMISFYDFISKSTQPHITECPYEEVKFNYNFNNWQSNYYFLQYSHDENVRSWGEEGFNKSGNYAICVD